METVSYKCLNCEAPLQYSAKKLKFYCEYCRSEYTEEELKKHFGQMDAELNNNQPVSEETQADDVPEGFEDFASGTVMYTCQSCGAEVITDKTTAATFCIYCHNPVVISNRLTGAFKPDKVIPFKFTGEDAENKFFEFCQNKHFLPKAFISTAELNKIRGVYYPYWMIDSKKDGCLYATAKKVRRWTQGDTEYTETKIFRCKRAGLISFKDFPHPALRGEHSKALKYVNPYNSQDFRGFTMAYLSGFLAEKRDTERSDVQGEVDQALQEYSKKIYLDTITGYDSVMVDSVNVKTMDEHWQYAMMPVWMMNFNYEGKDYLYAMNGQTGKNYGELPLDKKKLALFGVILFVALLLLSILGGFFLL
ncbi:MAG: TFIIB-type zinc ribbon-containing protein [Clostridia bacterium]|nr:TFIIB-type zinc ribbon-containing protein [Clostridia bacterium]